MDEKQIFLECERNRVFYLLMMSGGMLGAFTYVSGVVFSAMRRQIISYFLGWRLDMETGREQHIFLFSIYKSLERKDTVVKEVGGAIDAVGVIETCMENYNQKFVEEANEKC